MDNPAPDTDASVKSLGIFLQTKKNKWHNTSITIPLSFTQETNIYFATIYETEGKEK